MSTNHHGLWYSVGGGNYADKVQSAIEARRQFTATMSISDISPRSAELVLVSLDGTSIDYVGIAMKGPRAVTDQRRVSLTNLVRIGDLSVDQLRARVPANVSRFVDQLPARGPHRVPPATWRHILRIAEQSTGDSSEVAALKTLIKQHKDGPTKYGQSEIAQFERDAVATAVETWGGPTMRKRVLLDASPEPASEAAPFLSRLASAPIREDLQIEHDHSLFPEMEIVRRHQVGATVVFHHRGEFLTVVNCNRQPLERTLGVDLLYYSHVYASFVLVQYKRMTEDDKGAFQYRPNADPNFQAELDRMVTITAQLERLPCTASGLNEFRLFTNPFYFKFCKPRGVHALDTGLTNGMYVPLTLLQRLLEDPASKGPRGGALIGWDSCPRRFTNGQFTDLLRRGWIGTAVEQTSRLSDVVEAVLESGKMAVVAATGAAPDSPDYHRDEIGRFATHDTNDPTTSA